VNLLQDSKEYVHLIQNQQQMEAALVNQNGQVIQIKSLGPLQVLAPGADHYVRSHLRGGSHRSLCLEMELQDLYPGLLDRVKDMIPNLQPKAVNWLESWRVGYHVWKQLQLRHRPHWQQLQF
jgi:hypothetical protein